MANQSSLKYGESNTSDQNPVECLGMKFPNDDARRGYFSEKLREKMKAPAFRRIEGFPVGEDEDILALSDPPYYTACPNPFLGDYLTFANRSRTTQHEYRRLPYPAALDDSRNNQFINAHSYATKVPHEAVMRLVLHYTEPGDVVLDGFVGAGMTAVGVQLCGDIDAVESLGYRVDRKTLRISDANGAAFSRIGGRHAIVSDLCPGATHLSYNFNFPFDETSFDREVDDIAAAVERECGWMYKTRHGTSGTGRIICILWSDVFLCGSCDKEIVFWDAAVDVRNSAVSEVIKCPHCKATSRKAGMKIAWTTEIDPATRKPERRFRQVPVVVVYEVDGQRHEKAPDADDFKVIDRIQASEIPHFYPTEEMPYGYNTEQPKKSHGLTHVHKFFTKRNLSALACAWSHARSSRARFMLTSLMYKSSLLCGPLMSNYFASRRGVGRGGWIGKERSGTLYCPSIRSEVSILAQIATRRRAVKVTAAGRMPPIIGTASATQIGLPDNSVDYIFTDPPFGGNKMYSELAFMWEAWLRVFTNNKCEAIQNRAQKKGLAEYELLMAKVFSEYYRVLKPQRWITVEFSNTEAAVWNALQNAIGKAGFVIADVRDLHKQQGSILGYTTTVATRQDLAISAYKPDSRLEEAFRLKPGGESVWAFVRSHLQQLQVADIKGDRSNVIAERQGYVLFDRLVGFNVQRGCPVPISSPEFYSGLRQRFPERDGMYFLPEQVAEYEKRRSETKSLEQLSLFVTDEKSAIQWVRQRLTENPFTYQNLQPQFFTEAQRVWESHEKRLELQTILDQNFVKESDGTWHIPDTMNEAHLDQLRSRDLLREFRDYLETKGKLKVVRTEALRAGFKECWQEKEFTTIVQMAKRVPEAVVQEDQALLMYVDNASLMLGE